MKLKTYVVPTLTEAVERIKRDLGPKAVIISTKKVTKGSLLGIGSEAKIEVTAAIDDGSYTESTLPNEREPLLGQTVKIFSSMAEEKIVPLREEILRLKGMIESLNTNQSAKPMKEEEEISLTNLANQRSDVAKNKEEDLQNTSHQNLTSDELFAEQILTKLAQQGLNSEIMDRILNEYADSTNEKKDFLNWTLEWLFRHMPEPMQIGANGNIPRMIAFVGPTGSGKTTTLAKIATQLKLEHQRKIAIITLDHFRIGGDDQIRKYAHILQAPCALVRNKQEFKRALHRFEQADTILIDTIGRSPRDEQGISEIADILSVGDSDMWTSLVIPAYVRSPEDVMIAETFKKTNFNNIIVSKLDEAFRFGSVYNLSYMTDTPLSYLTIGQKVPEDIEAATAERVLDCLFNLSGENVHLQESLNPLEMNDEGRVQ